MLLRGAATALQLPGRQFAKLSRLPMVLRAACRAGAGPEAFLTARNEEREAFRISGVKAVYLSLDHFGARE